MFDSFRAVFRNIRHISNYVSHIENRSKLEKETFIDLENLIYKRIKDNDYLHDLWVDTFNKNEYNFDDFWHKIMRNYNNCLEDNLKLLNKLKYVLKENSSKFYKDVLERVNYTEDIMLKQKHEIEKILNFKLEKLFSLIISNIFLENFDNESIKNKKSLNEESNLSFFIENSFLDLSFFNENYFKLKDNFLDLTYFNPIFSDVTYIDDTTGILKDMIKNETRFNHSFGNFIWQKPRIESVFHLRNFNFSYDFRLKMNSSFKTKEGNDLNNIVDIKILNDKFQSYFNLKSSLNLKKSALSENGIDISLENSSKGLKIIKVFQELINKDFFERNTLLIIDEPEAFLHPKWQLFFIRLLLDIAEVKKIKIVISTHSPYIIETIDSLSQRDFKEIKFKYNYLSKNRKTQSVMIKSTNNPNSINEELSYPYKELEKHEFEWEQNMRKN